MSADTVDVDKTIHPHLALGESIRMAAGAVHGSCTDLPSVRMEAARRAMQKSRALRSGLFCVPHSAEQQLVTVGKPFEFL